MSNTKTLNKNKIDSLVGEVALLKSVMIGWIGKDKEGEYSSKFVDKVIEASKDKKPFKFTDKQAFLNHLKK